VVFAYIHLQPNNTSQRSKMSSAMNIDDIITEKGVEIAMIMSMSAGATVEEAARALYRNGGDVESATKQLNDKTDKTGNRKGSSALHQHEAIAKPFAGKSRKADGGPHSSGTTVAANEVETLERHDGTRHKKAPREPQEQDELHPGAFCVSGVNDSDDEAGAFTVMPRESIMPELSTAVSARLVNPDEEEERMKAVVQRELAQKELTQQQQQQNAAVAEVMSAEDDCCLPVGCCSGCCCKTCCCKNCSCHALPHGKAVFYPAITLTLAAVLSVLPLCSCGMVRLQNDYSSLPFGFWPNCLYVYSYGSKTEAFRDDAARKASMYFAVIAFIAGTSAMIAYWPITCKTYSPRAKWIIFSMVILVFISQLLTLAIFGTDACTLLGCDLAWAGIMSIIAAVLWLIGAIGIALIPIIPKVSHNDNEGVDAAADENVVESTEPLEPSARRTVRKTEMLQPDGTIITETITTDPDGSETITRTIKRPAVDDSFDV